MQYKKLSLLTTFAVVGMISAVNAQAAADTTINITAGVDSIASGTANIDLSGCPSTTTSIDAKFSGPSVAGDTSGFGMKDSGGTIVTTGSIRLANANTSAVISNTANTYTVTPSGGAATFKLKAYMHSITGSVKPGVYTTPIEVTYAYH
ncbi:MAG: fimbrial protein [Hafnia paralvei]|jgi:minor fimbrial subunit|uniref:fimbrial protein n=1 Tax=Hafnia paralvei TaxID=546367 RepID=UPI00158494E0|nr:fimbrial protein [Hafnia paralvei]MCE9879181.1 fimbrial protein [Hafnia paralvei]MCE9906385.1 fimbrial protein [Hafnia paralvei]MCE9911565.1 fimbrial protein [Hafnia paralvei]NUN42434.1 fimbrial protein [Hafnia paralvei]